MKLILSGIVAATIFAVVVFVLVGLLLEWPVGLRDQFCLVNSSGKAIVVTSQHTGESFTADKGSTVIVPHSRGSVVVKQQGGKTFTYEELSVMELHGTPFSQIRNYSFPFGASNEVTVVLKQDGRVFIGRADGRNADTAVMTQPPGFPLSPRASGRMP